MKLSREFREFFSTPAFYILAGIFLALSGYKFYSLLLSYMDTMSAYPDYIFGGEISTLLGLNVNTFLFPRLFDFYSYLVLIAVPVLNMGVGHDRMLDIDKIELLVSGMSEARYVMRKIFSTTIVLCVILLPTLAYPLILRPFASVDWGVVWSSYLGLVVLIFMANAIVSPLGVLKMPVAVSIFLNLVVLLLVHLYFLEPYFASFLYGVIRSSTIIFALIFSGALVFLSSKIYVSTRIF
jgi:hypothetical protein